jgi:hypothetical protein
MSGSDIRGTMGRTRTRDLTSTVGSRMRAVGALIMTVATMACLGTCAATALARGYVPTKPPTFGETGSGPGQMNDPSGLAVASGGDVFVTDGFNKRVEKWEAGKGVAPSYLSSFTGAGTPSPEFNENPFGLAVDNSGGLQAGDVYVAVDEGSTVSPVDEFRPKAGKPNEYEYVCQITGPGSDCLPKPSTEGGGSATPFKETRGVAVDANGNLFIAAQNSVYELSASGSEVKLLHTFPSATWGIAVAADGSLDYLYVSTFSAGLTGELLRLEVEPALDAVVSESVFEEKGTELQQVWVATSRSGQVFAVDREGGTPYVEVYEPNGSSAGESFGKGEIGEQPGGIAYSSVGERVYVSDDQYNDVHVFEHVSLPVVKTEAAREVGVETATLTGSVNPEGEPGTHFYFEWGETSLSEHKTTIEPLATGVTPVAVEAKLTGLKPHQPYEYELFAYNTHDEPPMGSPVPGGPMEFKTEAAPPVVSQTRVSDVGVREAAASALVDPRGEATSYRFEYGETEAYGQSTSEASAGEGEAATEVSSVLSGLRPQTTYHFQIVAKNATGAERGPDETFTTYPVPAPFALPDGRAYEQVSPMEKGTDAYSNGPGTARSAPSGDAVTFLSESPFPGVEGSPQLMGYVAQRGADGWRTQGLLPRTGAGGSAGVAGVTEDLAYSVVESNDEPPLAEGGESDKYNLYLHDTTTGGYSLFAKTHEARLVANTSGDSRILFETDQQLLPEATPGAFNLYEWHEGQVSLAGVLPDEKAPSEGSAAGAGGPLVTGGGGATLSQTEGISRDGTRVFFTDRGTGELYMRENGTETIPISGTVSPSPVVFQGATPSGSKVLFTLNGDLYLFDLQSEEATDIAPAGEVQGVAGMGGQGAYVYFVAKAVLASNKSGGGTAEAGQDNLYLWHESESTKFIARLSDSGANTDDLDWTTQTEGFEDKGARVSVAGTTLMFTSHEKPTGYENFGPHCLIKYIYSGQEFLPGYCNEIYLYAASSSALSCVSCNPTGASAEYPAELYPQVIVSLGLPSWGPRSFSRNLSDNGRRVVFETKEALSPLDRNGQTDVYEWEQAGEGSCPGSHTGGCVYLISTGESSYPSYLADASATGEDIFFFTRQKLVGQDVDENQDLYDARVGGGIAAQNPPPPPSECSGESCHNASATTPLFSAPSSVALSGQGNLGPPVDVKPKPKLLTKTQKLTNALDACHKKKNKKKRTACEKRAHQKYRVSAKAKKSKVKARRQNESLA